MAARHNQPRAVIGRPSQAVAGVVPGSTDHRILLALRGVGGMTSDQICTRFGGYQTGALRRLKAAGLLNFPSIGLKGQPISLTDKARELTDSDGPLNRRSTLITYCQL